ncbi:hypothetical protein CGZ80_14550 [Rhodopirellula sp. MGV]|nr:hypothetical protein CGZ80_14550 [Rhodopirellula sp. MGV]PNY37329.1 hypothetical protein C2E31_08625 [Rhodopirellula baltica]
MRFPITLCGFVFRIGPSSSHEDASNATPLNLKHVERQTFGHSIDEKYIPVWESRNDKWRHRRWKTQRRY